MNIGEFGISTDTVVRIILLFVYVPVCLIVFWWLIPRLIADAKRFAIGFLAALIIVIVIPLEYRPASEFERWLWHPDMEWNIPSIISSAQLALVGWLALLTACLDRAKRLWPRIYLVALGLFVLFLGLDEFFSWKSFTPGLQTGYVRLGVAMIMGTMIVAATAPRRERIWFICLLTGFALIAMGALVVDQNPRPCGSFGPLRFDGCMRVYILEEALEFLGSWLALVALLGQFSVASPSPSLRVRLLLYAMPALWILFVSHFSPARDIEVNPPDLPASVEFESGVRVYGYGIERGGLPSSIVLRLPDGAETLGLGFSVHLVDQVSGVSLASDSDFANRRAIVWPKRRGFVPLYRQKIEVEIPPQTPVNRAYWVVLSLWEESDGDYLRRMVLASDLELLSETQVLLGEWVLPAEAAKPSSAPLAVFDNGFSLDAVTLPEKARAGENLSIEFTWRSDAQGGEDHAQFLHLGHAESDEWLVYDQQPLGARLPTHLWYSGLADSETWSVPLPADLAPGRYEVFSGLYQTRDQERTPATDANGTAFLDARVPLGNLIIER